MTLSWQKSTREQYKEVWRLIRKRDAYTSELLCNEQMRGATENLVRQSIVSVNDALVRSYREDIVQATYIHFLSRDRVTFNYLGVKQVHSRNWTLPEKRKFAHNHARYDLLRQKAESERAT